MDVDRGGLEPTTPVLGTWHLGHKCRSSTSDLFGAGKTKTHEDFYCLLQ
jgi:hypothetical protein